jgi:uncharacterized OsmC-like protein
MTTQPIVRNGVPVHKLFATIDKLKANGSLAAFRFTAQNRWLEGTAGRSTIHEWHGMGVDHKHVEAFSFDADHPTLGHGHGPTPQEYVLHALAACMTAGIATTAAARKITLRSIDSSVTGEIDVRGVLGIERSVRNGFSQVTLRMEVSGDAEPEVLEQLVEASRKHSAVFDILTGETPVRIEAQGVRVRASASESVQSVLT